MVSPFQNYDMKKDPTFRLASLNKLTFQKIDQKNLSFENDNIDIVKLSAISDQLDDFNSDYLGIWNVLLAKFLMMERKMNPQNYFICERFAKLGILAKIMILSEDSTSIFMVIPPFLSQKWDEYYTAALIGEKAFDNIRMNAGRLNFDNFHTSKPVLRNYSDLKFNNTEGKTVGQSVEDLWNTFTIAFQGDSVARLGYVAVFGVNVDTKTPLLAVNAAYHISFQTFNSFGGFRLKPVVSMQTNLKTDYKKIFDENNKLIRTVSSTYNQPVTALYVVPIPRADIPLDFIAKPSQSSAMSGVSIKPPQDNIVATGLLYLGSKRSTPENKMPSGTSSIDCKEILPDDLQDLADEFNVQRQGKGDADFCQAVKEAISQRLPK